MLLAFQIQVQPEFWEKALESDVTRLALVIALFEFFAVVVIVTILSRVIMRLNKSQEKRDTSESLHQERLLKLLETNTAANTKLADTLALIDQNSRTERDTWHKLIEGQGANVGKVAAVVESLSKAITEQFMAQHTALDGMTGQVGGLKTALAANTVQIGQLTETIEEHTRAVITVQEETRQIVNKSWDQVLDILQDIRAMTQKQVQIVELFVEANKPNEKPMQDLLTAGSTVGVDADDRAAAGADQPAGDGAGRADTGSVRDEHTARDPKSDAGSNPDSTAG